MSYQIDRYNKTVLTVVENSTLDQTTDLKLVGKNYAGYGEIQNENFVFLLENFAGASAPPRAISGQVWFDSSQSKLKFYDGSKWRTTGGAEVLDTAPSGLTEGDFWWDTSNEQLYAYNGTDFVLVGPQDAGDGVTQMQSRTVRDTLGVNHSVIVSVVNDTIVHIISNDTFTIDNTDAENRIAGFDVVKQGITLVNTLAASQGITSTNHIFWGTAASAKGLIVGSDFVEASDFIRSGQASFASLAEFSDTGIAIGNSNDLRILIEDGNEAAIQNTAQKIHLRALELDPGDTDRPVDTAGSFTIKSNSIEPGTTADGVTISTMDIGHTLRPFNDVYAANFYGTSEKASALIVGANERQGDVSPNPNTIAVRDSSGDLRANLFRGTALSAKFADLAEKYTTESEYAVGTVVAVCAHEEHEMALATPSSVVAGVISEKPAFLMNEDSDGQAVALKGRVPVRVIGSVKKGDKVFVDQDGLASVDGNGDLVGVALESNNEASEKLVECFLKV